MLDPKKRTKITWIFPFIQVFLNQSCATKTITFTVAGTAKVSTVSPDNLSREGQFLGDTPLTVEVSKIQGKIIKISQSGKIPAYWVMPDVSGQNIRASLSLADEPQPPKATPIAEKEDAKLENTSKTIDTKTTINRIMRLLLKSYQALSAKNLPLAQELAARASSIDPEIAAPFVIKGIVLMQSGDNEGARSALSSAKTLDPEDQDIEKLLRAIR